MRKLLPLILCLAAVTGCGPELASTETTQDTAAPEAASTSTLSETPVPPEQPTMTATPPPTPLPAPRIVAVSIPAPEAVEPEVVLRLSVGPGQGQLGVWPANEAPAIGPQGFDVSADGTIAIADMFNERIILANPNDQTFASFPAPGAPYDVAFDTNGRIVVLDIFSKPVPDSGEQLPHLYLFEPDGTPVAEAPIYAPNPTVIVGGKGVYDFETHRVYMPFDEAGQARSHDEQWATRVTPELQGEGDDDPNYNRLVDTGNGLTFEVTSGAGLGAVPLFERTSEGYVAVFDLLPLMYRVIRFDREGVILQNVSFEAFIGEWMELGANVALGPEGAIYFLVPNADSPEMTTGFEILRIPAP